MTSYQKLNNSELTGLDLLRAPFPAHQISKLPKPTKAQTDAIKADFKAGIRCDICGAWHHPKVVHLDYVGHAALTDRLLDADPNWNWEPVALSDGLPAVDRIGGLWIRLTVCGVSRLGYGHAADKSGGDAVKEIIGDALRNAAMRFGAALDLWHKGDLHQDVDEARPEPVNAVKGSRPGQPLSDVWENSDQEIKELCLKVAAVINEHFESGDVSGAYEYYERQGLHTDTKAALWTQLPSKITTALKKEHEARRVSA